MSFNVARQEKYSRGQLLLRTLLGAFYIGIPHFFVLLFVSIWAGILMFVNFWIVLFTAKFPEGIFSFFLRLFQWEARLMASLGNLIDGYPQIGLKGSMEGVTFEVERPEKVSRLLVILRVLLGVIYVMIPHGFCLFFRSIGTAVLEFLAFWAVLFTGSYPEKWHAFNVGTMRWGYRLSLYMGFFNDKYPSFSGKE